VLVTYNMIEKKRNIRRKCPPLKRSGPGRRDGIIQLVP